MGYLLGCLYCRFAAVSLRLIRAFFNSLFQYQRQYPLLTYLRLPGLRQQPVPA